MTLTPDKILEVLGDPDIKQGIIEHLAQAQMRGYRDGLLRGITVCEQHLGIDLSHMREAAQSVLQETVDTMDIQEVMDAYEGNDHG